MSIVNRSLDQEVVHRISLLPALMEPPGLVAKSVAIRMHASLGGLHQYVPQLFSWYRVEQLLHVDITFVVDHLELVEEAVHVAFKGLVLVYLAIAELLDGLCGAYTFFNNCFMVKIINKPSPRDNSPSVTPVLGAHMSW